MNGLVHCDHSYLSCCVVFQLSADPCVLENSALFTIILVDFHHQDSFAIGSLTSKKKLRLSFPHKTYQGWNELVWWQVQGHHIDHLS